jgi:hypothetical protein
MSPPEVWGPPVWTFFHVLAEKVNEHAYPIIKQNMFIIIQKICGVLPCPECSQHATGFLGKVRINDLKNKTDFKNMLFFFHNYVNSRKRKRIYNYPDLEAYKKHNILQSFNNFIRVYHTRGNMNQLNESFQRQFVIKDVRKWLTQNIRAFIGASPTNKLIDNKIVIENPVILELPITTIEEPITTIELPVTTIEEPVTTIELPVTTIELPITTIELPITTIEEPVSFENIYVDNEFVSQNVFESNSHLFKDNLPNENFDEMLDIEIVYSNNSETVDSLLLDITEDHIMDLPVNVVVKKKPNKRKKK